MSKNNSEVRNCLDSMPEWGEYCENDLLPMTMIESKPLATDPRNRGSTKEEDDLEFLFRFNPNMSKKIQKSNNHEIKSDQDKA